MQRLLRLGRSCRRRLLRLLARQSCDFLGANSLALGFELLFFSRLVFCDAGRDQIAQVVARQVHDQGDGSPIGGNITNVIVNQYISDQHTAAIATAEIRRLKWDRFNAAMGA